MNAPFRSIVTVTLNPTIDRILEVPGFQIGGHQQGTLRIREPAGKAINVSRALAELGVKNTAIGWVGMNAFDLFHETMQSAGVKACFLPITGLTRENITIIDPSNRRETHIRDAGPSVDAPDVRRLTDLIQTVVGSESLAIFTGSLPPGLSPDAWSGLLQDCVNRGAQVVVDTAGEPLRRAVQQPLWMIKPNEEELGELTGEPMESESAILDAARRLNEKIPIVMVTVGRRGAYCLCEGHAWHAHASIPPESVKSTVGCGDAILAGFLSGLLASNGDVSHALCEGVAISVAATMTEEPARFDRGDVERIRRTVELKAIS